MHWLTFVFGFLTLYCLGALASTFFQGDMASIHDALLFWGIGAVIFAIATAINQTRHTRRKRDAA